MSSELLKALAAPFPAGDHEFFNGLVYLSEEAVAARLDDVCPEWTWELVGDPIARGGVIAQRGRLTISGIYRDGVGMAAAVMTKDGSREVNEPEKSAATDAFKRAARMFGVGRYLLRTPQSVRDYDTLARWLNGAKPQPQAQPAPQQQPQQQQQQQQPESVEFIASAVQVKAHEGKRYFVFADSDNHKASTFDTALASKAGQGIADATAGASVTVDALVTARLKTRPHGSAVWEVTDVKPVPSGANVPF